MSTSEIILTIIVALFSTALGMFLHNCLAIRRQKKHLQSVRLKFLKEDIPRAEVGLDNYKGAIEMAQKDCKKSLRLFIRGNPFPGLEAEGNRPIREALEQTATRLQKKSLPRKICLFLDKFLSGESNNNSEIPKATRIVLLSVNDLNELKSLSKTELETKMKKTGLWAGSKNPISAFWTTEGRIHYYYSRYEDLTEKLMFKSITETLSIKDIMVIDKKILLGYPTMTTWAGRESSEPSHMVLTSNSELIGQFEKMHIGAAQNSDGPIFYADIKRLF